ncbi:MORN repeat-containing protein 3 [Dendroctonus ponderosae]|uniref:MORN repeat-containing protein 3 n=1 Tax=Dendroctonus ponderosae TaxID=77166 RepID=J3JU49_DENPD|nr:MORN repeat-containing protein 3 [Dendroctonus ponderosae]AEE61723.1 unknown [Dendroctonus ponderosae]KAH1000074.1 hypothetical protein HUJ04_000007 [Dendroctonus ponderosae]KAH1003386.1 hypothetical protein HUJ05_011310 [Dendroctonus ponderosae]
MPFFKPQSCALPRSRQLQNTSKRNGVRSTIFNTVGDWYVGEWLEDQKTGKGVIGTRDGQRYEGELAQNRRHGFGVLAQRIPGTDVFRLSYRGNWQRGRMHGEGLRVFPDGSFYIGLFRHGKRHGHGRQWYADGAFFDGQYVSDVREGLGLLIRADGNRFEGEWKKDRQHGRGRFYHLKSGQLQEGVWVDGSCVHSRMRDIDYRQCCIEPTAYAIPEVALLHADDVSHLATEGALPGIPDWSGLQYNYY